MAAANPPADSAAAVPPADAPPDPRRWLPTAFWWAFAIFCFSAVVAAVLFRWGPLATQGQPAAAEAVGAKAQGSPEPGAVPG